MSSAFPARHHQRAGGDVLVALGNGLGGQRTLLNPGGRDITRGRPMHLVWGNHDVRGAWAFRMPELVALHQRVDPDAAQARRQRGP